MEFKSIRSHESVEQNRTENMNSIGSLRLTLRTEFNYSKS